MVLPTEDLSFSLQLKLLQFYLGSLLQLSQSGRGCAPAPDLPNCILVFIKKPEKGNMITWQYIHLTNLTECIQCVTLWLQSTRDRAVSKTDKVPYLKE